MTIVTISSPDFDGSGVAIRLTVFFVILGSLLKTKTQGLVDLEKHRQQLGIIETTSVHHVEGLPISEKTRCQVTLYNDKLVIEGGGINFNLHHSQITALEIKTDVEIANIVHSSALKGITGGLLFGPIGLMVGLKVTNKEKKTLHNYLIINYINSNNEVAALLFIDDLTPYLTRVIVSSIKSQPSMNITRNIQL
ncbi:hypothetical protein [Paenibacillus endoradicis]|uniref:hypothetical protein n=1 Tax=Paenibacillus endoradicis TaxID=2972487 RepID=UPI0021591550|nr:hypothetical protein [Paenibacillus endoradicis]MCR8660352.1 hypothetical protein [Paenibacillus endoradicis]